MAILAYSLSNIRLDIFDQDTTSLKCGRSESSGSIPAVIMSGCKKNEFMASLQKVGLSKSSLTTAIRPSDDLDSLSMFCFFVKTLSPSEQLQEKVRNGAQDWT